MLGGEDTLSVAGKLCDAGANPVDVPKIIDNDDGGTDYTFGFGTAVSIAIEAIDRLHTTGDVHKRTFVVEVMRLHSKWIALHAGIAGGVNTILIPEQEFDLDQVCAWVEISRSTARRSSWWQRERFPRPDRW